jgi:hypothetical protein
VHAIVVSLTPTILRISRAGFNGPWIENVWISSFIGQPFETFGAFVPLFVQWTDCWISGGWDASALVDAIVPSLRLDMVYM